MTAEEFKIAFNTRYYAEVGVNAMGWSNDEIDEFLNYGQLTLITTLAQSGNLGAISNLIDTENATELMSPAASAPSLAGEYKISPVENLFYLIDGRATIVGSGTYPIEKIEPEHIEAFKVNPFNQTYFRFPRACQNGEESVSILLSDGLTLESYSLRYVKKPDLIDIDSGGTTNLNSALHNGIIDLAVKRAVEVTVKTGQSAQ